MSLGIAFIGFIFLFFLVFCLFFTWSGFFSSVGQKTTNLNGVLEESPEWRAFLDRRVEIERDPTLDEQTRRTLIDNWQVMAEESRPLMLKSVSPAHLTNAWARPVLLPYIIAGTLLLAVLLTYAMGAMRTGALTWPSQNTGLVASTPSVDQAVVASEGHPGDGASLEERLVALTSRLQQQPDDFRGWVLLARTHASMSNYSESATALKTALELSPGHPDVLADLADMTAMAQGRQLAGEPEQYIAAALQSDPRHEKALALAASAAEQGGDTEKAQVYWQLLSQVQQSNLKNTAPIAPAENALTTVNVDVPESALNSMNENSALFVFMKAQDGPGMPMAVVRVPATQLSAGVQAARLGPGDFIQEGAINDLPDTLYFQARLSIQGMAQTTVGDIESTWVSVATSRLESGVNISLPANGSR